MGPEPAAVLLPERPGCVGGLPLRDRCRPRFADFGCACVTGASSFAGDGGRRFVALARGLGVLPRGDGERLRAFAPCLNFRPIPRFFFFGITSPREVWPMWIATPWNCSLLIYAHYSHRIPTLRIPTRTKVVAGRGNEPKVRSYRLRPRCFHDPPAGSPHSPSAWDV